jgi:hypothetical protein
MLAGWISLRIACAAWMSARLRADFPRPRLDELRTRIEVLDHAALALQLQAKARQPKQDVGECGVESQARAHDNGWSLVANSQNSTENPC